MPNKELKKIMTDLAAGHITQEQANNLTKPKKVAQTRPDEQFGAEKEVITEKTQKRQIKSKGRLK